MRDEETKRQRDEVKCRRRARTSSLRLSVSPSLHRGFSLTEILIVIAIIVLLLALAMPAFNFITGGRSADAAMNQISAFLARARTEAVGVQEPRGVLFYLDPATDREMMVLVKPTPTKESVDTTNNSAVDVWLGLASNADHLALPKGVGIQLANDSSRGVTGNWERYIGFNLLNGGTGSQISGDPPLGGVIMFDAYGRLASLHYGFRMTDISNNRTGAPSDLGKLAYAADIRQNSTFANATDQTSINVNTVAPLSAFGFLLFDRNLAEAKWGTGFNQDKYFVANSAIPGTSDPEYAEEQWLDSNATPVLINRYNGTLVKGE